VSNFIVQALLGRDITVYGDGSQMRFGRAHFALIFRLMH
jgi:dTDP-D-glucose 4,6-dehydratase